MGISTASSFKSKSTKQLELPSGETALCRRGGIEVFLRSGKVPNSLMPIMKAAMTGEKVKEAAEEIQVDENTIMEMFEMFDLVAIMVMVDPKCHSVPENPSNRKDDLLYVDELELEDKQFLFQWAVGGTSDVEKFRHDTSDLLESVLPSKAIPTTPVLPPPSVE